MKRNFLSLRERIKERVVLILKPICINIKDITSFVFEP